MCVNKEPRACKHNHALCKSKAFFGSHAGQGLGATGQGMASALEASGQKHRAGLGFASQGSQPTAPPESYAPSPDAQIYIDNAQPVSASEAETWDVVLQVKDVLCIVHCIVSSVQSWF